MAFDTSMSVWGSLSNLPDLAKQYLFQVRFLYESGSGLSAVLNADDFMIRARTASLPQKTFGQMDTQYMGTKLVYPGKMTVDGDFEVQWDEFQDLTISTALHRWANMIVNQGFKDDIGGSSNNTTGGAISNYIKDYSCTVEVLLYDSTLNNLLPVKWRLYRVWPKTIANVGLDQNGDGKITRNCTFSYSTFEVIYT